MRSIRRRGTAARASGSSRSRRSPKIAIALAVAVVACLAFAVSAGASIVATGTSTGPGVNGIDLTTQADTTPIGYTQPTGYSTPTNDGLGVPAGAIKHVWVIILENHAFESNFTGLDDNSYTSKVLPQDGALLTNYYGTGHSSLDNYTSLVSGQGPLTDDQQDCPAYNQAAGTISTAGGSLTNNPNYGQLQSAAGANAPAGDNGCVYPSSVPTLFNQLDANHTSWKVYAQDLTASNVVGSGATAGQNAGTQYCGAPDATPGPTPSASQTSNPGAAGSPSYVQGSAQPTDQYVAKHNPLPWFMSDLNSGDCADGHLATLFGPNDQLYSDLQNESTTPQMNFIIPDNCSNGHDSVCVGNNLSGGFTGQTPNPAENNVGGAYSADLFLEHTIPEIMKSPAYSDGGLIAVIWDEAYPQFTYSNDSFANSAVTDGTAATDLDDDEAGETLFGRSLNWEPSGPNSPNVYAQSGQELSGGPGFNEYLDRPSNYTTTNPESLTYTQNTATTVTDNFTFPTGAVTNSVPAPLVPCTSGNQLSITTTGTDTTGSTTTATTGVGYYTMTQNGCYLAGGTSGTDAVKNTIVSVAAGASEVTDVEGTSVGYTANSKTSSGSLISTKDSGQAIAFPTGSGVTFTDGGSPYTGPVYVGQLTASLPAALPANDATGTVTDTQSPGSTDTTAADQGPSVTFQLVDANGNPVSVTGAYSGLVAFGGETPATDPLYDAYDGTTGGGDTGAILLSPYITGGTVSNNYYNHYSMLRSLEDIFDVSDGSGSAPGYTGPINVSTGVDGLGHLGYAGQPGLAPFGTDVFTNSPFDTATTTVTAPGTTATVTKTQTVTQTQTVSVPAAVEYYVETTPGSTTTVTVKVVQDHVPALAGLTLAQAKTILSDAGLAAGKVSAPKAKAGYNLVVSKQSIAARTLEKSGTKVNLTLVNKKK